ncbi:MAG: hypothetical protein QOD09_2974 [Bradyrhizobium sp.]|jgi:hypothetical protein|nr:hypothetical protein [Bradyrhizobium sp.]
MTRPTIVTLESGKREPRPATLFVLINELAAAGIVFTKRCVELRKWPAPRYVPTGIKKKKDGTKSIIPLTQRHSQRGPQAQVFWSMGTGAAARKRRQAGSQAPCARL